MFFAAEPDASQPSSTKPLLKPKPAPKPTNAETKKAPVPKPRKSVVSKVVNEENGEFFTITTKPFSTFTNNLLNLTNLLWYQIHHVHRCVCLLYYFLALFSLTMHASYYFHAWICLLFFLLRIIFSNLEKKFSLYFLLNVWIFFLYLNKINSVNLKRTLVFDKLYRKSS